MRLLTSYFDSPRVSGGKRRDTVFVSVAGRSPDWIEFKCRKLAPKRAWWNYWHSKFEGRLSSDESKAWYAAKYRETVLAAVIQREIVGELEAFGCSDVFLLCWEKPEEFCHRQLIAEWLNEAGFRCEEATA